MRMEQYFDRPDSCYLCRIRWAASYNQGKLGKKRVKHILRVADEVI